MMNIPQWRCTNKEEKWIPNNHQLNNTWIQNNNISIPSQHIKPIIDSKWAVQNYVKMATTKSIAKKSIKSKNIIKKVKNAPSNVVQSSMPNYINTKMIISPNQISKQVKNEKVFSLSPKNKSKISEARLIKNPDNK